MKLGMKNLKKQPAKTSQNPVKNDQSSMIVKEN